MKLRYGDDKELIHILLYFTLTNLYWDVVTASCRMRVKQTVTRWDATWPCGREGQPSAWTERVRKSRGQPIRHAALIVMYSSIAQWRQKLKYFKCEPDKLRSFLEKMFFNKQRVGLAEYSCVSSWSALVLDYGFMVNGHYLICPGTLDLWFVQKYLTFFPK